MLLRLKFLLLICILIPFPVHGESTTIRVGIDNNPPLTFIDAQGQASGLLPDLFTQIAKAKKWTIKYVPCQWQQCLESLATNDIDILPAIAYTRKRANQFHFANEVIASSWGQIYQQSDSKLTSVLELAGKKMAVLKQDIFLLGEQGMLHVAKNFNIEVEYVEVESYREAFTQLQQGTVDAAMVGRFYGFKNAQKFNLIPTPIMINPIQIRPAFATAVPERYRAEFDQSLHEWKQSSNSIYYNLIDKWFDAKTPDRLPTWLMPALYSLLGALLLLLFITLWTRKQVKIKTLELSNQRQHYRVFFEESQSIKLLVDPETANIVDANPAACRFYQYSPDQLKNMKMWQINQIGEGEVKDRLTEAISQDQQQFERIHTRADGTQVPVEVYRSPIQNRGRTLLYSIIHDISKRKKAEQELEERNKFLQSVIDGVSDPMMVIGLDYQILQLNESARKQQPEEPNSHLTCHQLSHASQVPCTGDNHPCPLVEVQETGGSVTMIHQHVTSQGKRIYELCASPLFDAKGEIYAIIEVARDITERLHIEELLNENEKRLHHLAHHDSLTDLPNRLLFDDRLKQALSKSRRSGRQIALFFLDLDHLKCINDNLGHSYGDLLLIDVAKRLRACVRESDTVARMGGDEFLVLLEDIESIEMVATMAERICDSLTHELVKGEFKQKISVSIGISIYPDDAKSGPEMMKNADLAMYRVKKSGKANYQFYSAPQGRFLFD
ncbi:PAS domain S-box-containing protein/diguanylate cyclase (GGDEF) domain-containing protein [Desulfuromusa kysingii]|uniref:PAS domain S-box-containing protein/diguanylate cyclase (GGDEF) domain-containing protein n=1 Tax=Desulfuromusa kysingii TaxID=37625 RepID=A0A1H4E480_9BACT|nr:diguanylate cyclase [Desulfuromusa kysingii]SEA79831.1 PAS domain S-box-containing protein/diguanylate cyclase (GGDEF) domain-containing protein [Desulfuromusa kysingii]